MNKIIFTIAIIVGLIVASTDNVNIYDTLLFTIIVSSIFMVLVIIKNSLQERKDQHKLFRMIERIIEEERKEAELEVFKKPVKKAVKKTARRIIVKSI